MPESVDEKARLTDARGDFVASLGRRLQTLRAALKALEEKPDDRERRNALLRRAHALGASARVLGFASVAEALGEAERAIARGRQAPRPSDLAEVSRVLDVVPSLVGGAQPSLRPPAPAEAAPEQLTGRQWPLSLLLFGGQDLEVQLTDAVQRDSVEFERSEDTMEAAHIARVLGPDLVLLDADAPSARDFFRGLCEDEFSEPVQSIFVGEFNDPSEPRELTVLGATRVLKKPVAPDTLRRTIEELYADAREPRDPSRPLGDLTVRGLCQRIAEELEHGLVQAAAPGTQATHVPFGGGADVMAAVWGTVTRVRELVTLHSQGAVRFDATGPEGAIPLAPWIEVERRAGERGTRHARDEAGVPLSGRTVLVADDDPAVAWFLSGLLKTVGARVIEAYDGVQALELVTTRWPDLVVSDILMPKLDGFSLCREIKRDVAVRDVPVILLSWKEDLLQRMRELGADADGYLRKEAEASTVVQRIREVMRPRARVEARVAQGGEVRGRLDGLTPRLILELCCKSGEDLRIELRDAFFTYSMQVRRGSLVSARRTGAGPELTGAAVMRGVLGVNAGRFLVVPDASQASVEFRGELTHVLAPAIDHARRCLRALSFERLPSVTRISMNESELGAYLASTPEPAKGALLELAAGAKPSEVLLSGTIAPELLVSALTDLARRGVIESVDRVGGASEPAPVGGGAASQPPPAAEAGSATAGPESSVASETGFLAQRAAPRSTIQVEPEPVPPLPAAPAQALLEQPSASPASSTNPPGNDPQAHEEPTMSQVSSAPSRPGPEAPAFTFELSPDLPPVVPKPKSSSPVSESPPAVDDALDDAAWFSEPDLSEVETRPLPRAESTPSEVRFAAGDQQSEVATRTPPPVAVQEALEPADPLAKTQAATPAPPLPSAAETPTSDTQLAELLTQVVAGDASEAPPAVAAEPASRELLPATRRLSFPRSQAAAKAASSVESPRALEGRGRAAARSEPEPEPDAPRVSPSPEPIRVAPAVVREAPVAAKPRALATPPNEAVVEREEAEPAAEAAEQASSEQNQVETQPRKMRPPTSPEPRDTTSTLKVIGYALVAMVFSYLGMSAVVAWFSDPATEQSVPTAADASATAPAVANAPVAPAADEPPASVSGQIQPASPSSTPPKASAEPKVAIEDVAVPPGLALGPDKGVLKIVTPDAHTIYVDGEFAGRGPVRLVPLAPGSHAVKIRFDGEESSFNADVKAGRMTRLTLAGGE